jgi:hypothetical protein
VIPSFDDGPARVVLTPVNALQFAWLALAVTIEALAPPFEVGGVYECHYCGRLFAGDRSRVRGDHVFCSPRHGKNYWARESMRKRRAREKGQAP